MRSVRALVLLALLALSGCYEEQVTVTLQPDGSGTLRLSHTEGGGLSALGGMFEFGEGNAEQRANRKAARHLAGYAGIVAWTDVQATSGEDGRTTVTAVGWFDDLAQVVKQGAGQGGERWSLTREDGALVVTLADSVDPGDDGFASLGPDVDEVLGEPLDELRGQQMALPLMLQGMLSGFKANLALRLPGPAEQAEGWSEAEGPTVRLIRDAAWAGGLVRRNFQVAIGVRQRLDAGELTREQAVAELARLQAELDRHTVRCDGSVAPDPAFAGRLAAARQAWGGSPWRRLLDEAALAIAREQAEAEAEAEVEVDAPWEEQTAPPPAGLTRTEPDAFEPNDSLRRATPLGPDGYENLLLDRSDWYRVDVPGAFELRVTVLYDESQGMLGLSITDEDGAELADADAFTADHTSVARHAPGKTRTLLIHLESYQEQPLPYHMQVELLPFEPADRFEPNDEPSAAKPLAPGRHDDLVCNGQDHYLLTVPAGHVVRAALIDPQGDELVGRLNLELTERDDTKFMAETLARSAFATDGGPPQLTCRGTGAPLVLKVHTGFSQPDGSGIPYRLELTIAEDPKPDALEPNQTRGAARRLKVGSYEGLLADPEDWYSVQLPEGQQLQLDFAAQGELTVEVLGWKRRQALVEREGAQGSVVWGPGADGETPLLVRVRADSLVAYRLELAFTDFVPADAHEPNDTRAQAAPIERGRLADLVCTSDDFYALELEAGQSLSVTLEVDSEAGSGWLQVSLLDPLGMELATIDMSDAEPLAHQVEAAGTYYLHVRPLRGTGVGTRYALTID